MDYITIIVSYGSYTHSFTSTRNTTWSDLCASIHDRSGIPVTSLYHRNSNGDIRILSSDDDWKTLVYGCNTSCLQLSIYSSVPWNGNNLNITQQDGLGRINTLSRPTDKTFFTSQFETFGKLMDKYNDLIQSDDDMKTMMHQMALELTLHQNPSVDLAEIEARLEKRLGNATAGTNASRSAIDDNGRTAYDSVSLALCENPAPSLSRSTTLPSTIGTVPSPLYNNHIKRASTTTPSYSTNNNKYMDQLPTTLSTSYNPRQIVKGTIHGEWPAYSSLYPPPESPQHVIMDGPSSSSPQSFIDYDHQTSTLSLYPQPPTMSTTQSDRTSRLTSNWVPSASPPPSTMKPNTISNRSSFGYNNNNNDSSKHLVWYDDDDHRHNDPWRSSEKRQSYKEQHRVLKSQQKELERAIRHLKQQEKLEKQEYRKKLLQQQQLQLQQQDDVNKNSIRKSSSLSSLSSSTSSIYSASSALNDPCLQHQNHRLETTYYFPTAIPAPSTERPYRNIIGRVDDQHQDYGLDSRFGIIDKTSHDNGGSMTFLADTLDQLTMNENTGLHSHGSIVL